MHETYVFENESKYTEYINNLVDIILDDVVAKHEQSNKFAEDIISDTAKEIRQKLQDSSNGKFRIYGKEVSLPFVMFAKLQDGKIIERTFGTKENGQQYTQEEIKVILKEAEEIECEEKFKDGRKNKFTFLSMIVDINDELINKHSPIIFVETDIEDDKQHKKDLKKHKIIQEEFDKIRQEKLNNAFNNIQQAVNKAKQDPNSPNILLIPYSADGHIGTLLVDKSKVRISETGEVLFNNGSIMCFDSSHYFTGYTGWIKEHFGSESKPFKEKHFSFELYGKLKDNKKPINDKIIQGLEGTCSFYTEAFCYLVSKYIQDNKDNKNFGLSNIEEYINSKEFIKQLKDKKEEFFNEYKATMKKVERKQEQQKQKIKKEITDNITVQQNRQLTPDERHYQQLLNQYGVYRYGQEFMDDINGIDGINNSNPLNPDQQNALVREFIGSDVITRLNGGREIIVGFNHNREAFINTVYDAQQPNSVLNGGTMPVNFIYTLGTKQNQNPDAGTHYVAGQIFKNPATNELVVLHYDSLNGTVSDEFERYIRNEFGGDIQIVNS